VSARKTLKRLANVKGGETKTHTEERHDTDGKGQTLDYGPEKKITNGVGRVIPKKKNREFRQINRGDPGMVLGKKKISRLEKLTVRRVTF